MNRHKRRSAAAKWREPTDPADAPQARADRAHLIEANDYAIQRVAGDLAAKGVTDHVVFVIDTRDTLGRAIADLHRVTADVERVAGDKIPTLILGAERSRAASMLAMTNPNIEAAIRAWSMGDRIPVISIGGGGVALAGMKRADLPPAASA